MISASDILQIISEIHQYSMLLIELRDATTFGITRTPNDKMNYFQVHGRLGPVERGTLVQSIYAGQVPVSAKLLSVEEFLRDIEGKKARHIWLETAGADKKELAFLSISELKSFLRTSIKH